MSFTHWPIAAAVAVLMPLAAAAQPTHQAQKLHQGPADAAATVPPMSYESAFRQYGAVADDDAAPDKTWRAANEEVARLRGHAGHLQSSDAPHSSAPAHVGHGKHH